MQDWCLTWIPFPVKSNLSENYWRNPHKTGQGLNLQKSESAAVCLLCASVLVHRNHTLQDLPVHSIPIRTRSGHVLPGSHQILTKEEDGMDLAGLTAYAKDTDTSSRRQQTGWQARLFIVSWLWKGETSLPASLPRLSHGSYVLPGYFSFPQSIAMSPTWQKGPGSPGLMGRPARCVSPIPSWICFSINREMNDHLEASVCTLPLKIKSH